MTGRADEVTVVRFKSYPDDLHRSHPRMYMLLQGWNETLRDYEIAWWNAYRKGNWGKTDLPYVYNEEALVGILAFAAVKLHAYPFIEFDQDKRTKTCRGRQDLNIIYPNDRKLDCWTIEAALARVDCRTHKPPKAFDGEVEYAKQHAICHLKVNRSRRYDTAAIAIVFVTLTTKCQTESIRRTAEEFFKQLTRKTKPDFAALHLCRPDILRESRHPHCPGQAILGWYHGRKRP